jgi:hypothetical protein
MNSKRIPQAYEAKRTLNAQGNDGAEQRRNRTYKVKKNKRQVVN